MGNSYIPERENVISVTGYGRLFVNPNYINISISLKCCTDSMKSSFIGINDDMKNLFTILTKYELGKEYVQVVDLNFSPKYEWKNDVRKFLGYEVLQEVNIEMDSTKENEEKTKRILGLITSLKYLCNCDIEYGLKNKKKYLDIVRELSFKNAVEKAEQYAGLADVKIIKVNSLTDQNAVGEYSRSNSSIGGDDVNIESDSYLPNGRKIVLENIVHVTFDIGK
jgi:uncharacterized protein YggE